MTKNISSAAAGRREPGGGAMERAAIGAGEYETGYAAGYVEGYQRAATMAQDIGRLVGGGAHALMAAVMAPEDIGRRRAAGG